MNIQQPTPLRARMISDMAARTLGPASQTSHLRACKRFAAWLGRSPETATPDDVTYFQQYLVESGISICTHNQTMTGVKFLFRVTLRRHDLVAEIFSLRELVKVPLVLSKKEVKRILAMAPRPKAHVILSLAYGCGMRAGEVVRLKVGDIDSAQEIIRIVQAKGRKDRNEMLPADILGLLREWWKERPTGQDKDVPVHMSVPGGGLSADGTKWIACRKNFFLSVRVLSRLYRRLILEGLIKRHKAGKLHFFGDLTDLADQDTFDAFLKPLRRIDWVVYAKEPFAGPKAVLAYPPLGDASITRRARVALHPYDRRFQQPPDPFRCAQCHLPRQRLPP